MKNMSLMLAFIAVSFLFPSHRIVTSEVHQLLKNTFELESIQEMLAKGEASDIAIITNQLINDDFALQYEGKTVKSIKNEAQVNDESLSLIHLTKFDVKKNKARVQFNYKHYKVSLRFKKGIEGWDADRVFIHGKGYLNVDF